MRESQVRRVRLGDGVVFLDPRALVAVALDDTERAGRTVVTLVFRGGGELEGVVPAGVGTGEGAMFWLRDSLLEREGADAATLDRVAEALYRYGQGRSDWSTRDPADPSVVHYRRIAKVAVDAAFEVAP